MLPGSCHFKHTVRDLWSTFLLTQHFPVTALKHESTLRIKRWQKHNLEDLKHNATLRWQIPIKEALSQSTVVFLQTHLAGLEVKHSLLCISLLLGCQRCHLVFFLPLQKHLLGRLVRCGFTRQKHTTITRVKRRIHHIVKLFPEAASQWFNGYLLIGECWVSVN